MDAQPKQRFDLIAALKALPLIRFALMLGGGMMATIGAGFVTLWLAYSDFPDIETVWTARIHTVGALGIGSLLIVGIVMITLAWGKASGVKLSKGDVSAEVSFDGEDDKS